MIFEQPHTDPPCTEKPYTEEPHTEEPYTEQPCTDNPARINKDITSTEETKCDGETVPVDEYYEDEGDDDE